jgi:hypothetical protein
VLTSLGHSKAGASASELLARALLGLVADIAQRPHSIWLAGENMARNQLDSAFKVCSILIESDPLHTLYLMLELFPGNKLSPLVQLLRPQ